MPFDFEGQGLSETAKVLLAAAQRVRQGWCQHVLEDDSGNVCALGAIVTVVYGCTHQIHYLPAGFSAARFFAARDALHKQVGTVSTWNNDPSRTQEEVAMALEMAAFGDEGI